MTPDLMMQVTCRLSAEDAKRIAAGSWIRPDVFDIAVEPMERSSESRWRLHIPAGHDLLTEEADWGAPTWDMDPAGLERLATTLEWLYQRVPGELTFEAMWGDSRGELPVRRAQLVDIVRAGEIGNNIVYRVGAEPEGPQPSDRIYGNS